SRPKKPPRAKKPEDEEIAEEGIEIAEEPAIEAIKKGRRRKKDEAPTELARIEPSEAEHELRDVEQRFLALKGPLDLPARQALWPAMARLNGVLGHADAAAICWAHALWDAEAPALEWLAAWFQAEQPQAEAQPSALDLERILSDAHPTLADMRALVA